MAKVATTLEAAGKAKPAASNTPGRKARPVGETSSSTGQGETPGGNTEAPHAAQSVGQEAQPETSVQALIVAGAVAPASVNPGGSHADGGGLVRDASETGQVSEDGSAAAASRTAPHPAAPLIEAARVARGPADDEPAHLSGALAVAPQRAAPQPRRSQGQHHRADRGRGGNADCHRRAW